MIAKSLFTFTSVGFAGISIWWALRKYRKFSTDQKEDGNSPSNSENELKSVNDDNISTALASKDHVQIEQDFKLAIVTPMQSDIEKNPQAVESSDIHPNPPYNCDNESSLIHTAKVISKWLGESPLADVPASVEHPLGPVEPAPEQSILIEDSEIQSNAVMLADSIAAHLPTIVAEPFLSPKTSIASPEVSNLGVTKDGSGSLLQAMYSGQRGDGSRKLSSESNLEAWNPLYRIFTESNKGEAISFGPYGTPLKTSLEERIRLLVPSISRNTKITGEEKQGSRAVMAQDSVETDQATITETFDKNSSDLENKTDLKEDIQEESGPAKDCTDEASDIESVNKEMDEILSVPDPGIVESNVEKASGDQTVNEVETEGSMIEGAWADILGSGQLKKKTLRKGKSKQRPSSGDVCKIRYTGKLSDGLMIDTNDDFEFVLGDSEVIHAFDLIVALMELGEICQVETSPRFAYGEIGVPPKIPPNATIVYEIELIDSKPEKAPDELSLGERRKTG
ncbi:hypothetical protein QYM36_001370, partial [Artemia franciscana]